MWKTVSQCNPIKLNRTSQSGNFGDPADENILALKIGYPISATHYNGNKRDF